MNKIDELIELMFVMSRLTKEGMEHEQGSPSYIQLQALSFILKHKNPNMKTLAKHLSITPPSTTFLINTLIKLNLVNRITDKQDKRITRLHISAKGRKTLQLAFTKSKKHLQQKLSLLSSTEQRNFILILKKLSLLLIINKNEY